MNEQAWSTLPTLNAYVVPDRVFQILHLPAECRVLNYNDDLSSLALRELQDRQLHVTMGSDGNVPPGLSQTSHFDESGNDDVAAFIYNNDDDDEEEREKHHTSLLLKSAFYDTAEAINNSNSKEKYEREFLFVMNDIMLKARADCDANLKERGKRVSAYAANSKRKKTHGTAHMNYR